MAEVELPPKVGDIVNDTYKIVRKISHGDFRPIFCTIDIKMRQIALMLEKDTDGQTEICIESAILKILANSNHIPKFYKYGSYKSYKFLAFQLLGPNMIDLVNYKKPYRFSLHSILKFGIQAIETLQIGNFLIGNTQETSGTFYLIGFGLCKKLNRKNDIIVKPTKKGRFRGSLKYSSLNAHNHIELGRQDDLISLLYIFVEFYNGALPWPDVDEINIQTLKEQRSSVLSPPLFLGKSNTVQEFIEVLDALTGIKSDDSFNPFDINPRSESQSPVRQDNYVEQFIDGMKKKDDKYKQFDWNSFVEQTGGSHQNEGFDGIDISERDDPHSDTTTQSSTVPQYLSFLNRNSISLQKSQSGSQVSLEIYSPPIVEDSQQSPHINMYRQRYLSPSNSAKERKISPEILSQEVHPINEVIIHNQPGSSRTHNTLLANLMVNKSPQLFIQQVRQQFDPTPKSPLGVKITEELKDWGMNESQKNAMGGIKEKIKICTTEIIQIIKK
ncbi:MAG: putative protein serine/threonine kinase [Streblomastix strix]|uniref:Protein kinase domain-containing protein n=1 Tax=Streblomastix strix TaxID=222440 RepID=A0A5J4W9Y6_9EUKA|nr:MAG: putative protein serine/threonine kinase [Streblomastix strix]